MTEAELQIQVADYLRIQYPDVIFHSDFGSGVSLTQWQAARQKRQNGGQRAWPDMFIAEPRPRCIDGGWKYEWHGLFIELKREKTRIWKKNGEFASDHIREQYMMLERLRERGYQAKFAVGFDEAKQIIDEYLGGKNGDI